MMTTLPLLYSYINLAPFLPHIEHCFANLIFSEPLDFTSLEFPIFVSTPRHEYYPNNSSCDAMNTLFTAENEPGFGICPRIKNNFHIKQVTWLAVALIMAREEDQIDDAIWYVNEYWNGYKKGGYYTYPSKLPNGTTIQIKISRNDVTYFPSRIYTQILMSPYQGDKKHARRYNKHFLNFDKMSVVLVEFYKNQTPGIISYDSVEKTSISLFHFSGARLEALNRNFSISKSK